MTIELKYKIGDTVWYMSANKAISAMIVNWVMEGNQGGPTIKTYYLKHTDNIRQEYQLYSTKEELLASL